MKKSDNNDNLGMKKNISDINENRINDDKDEGCKII